ncbi:DUF3168 domain-containing protein [Sphingomonas sp. BGYR3]|uniref:DUF3168 domain-containing protein n=1 Tax=Sphingomonas sp. BGYR3 TaxID=2975483 RepID=UPI0021A8993C|nr:DUF3168 domain-containing protein [Sphingomonas sp. BGYR3]MDG5489128.1 DUF3168 domain-containing protein [Sphingomonas sp. BGYR3]
MSAAAVLKGAVADALAPLGVAVLAAPPGRALFPHLILERPVLADWSARGCEGREGRIAVQVHAQGSTPDAAEAMLAEVEAAVLALPTQLTGDWRLVALSLTRSRMGPGGEGRWIGLAEFRVRMVRGI